VGWSSSACGSFRQYWCFVICGFPGFICSCAGSRALFASLLTSVWGISPTHSMWDRHRKKILVDHSLVCFNRPKLILLPITRTIFYGPYQGRLLGPSLNPWTPPSPYPTLRSWFFFSKLLHDHMHLLSPCFHRVFRARIQLFSALAAAFKGLRHLSRHLKMFDEEFRNLLSVQEHLQLVRRWNVISFKLGCLLVSNCT